MPDPARVSEQTPRQRQEAPPLVGSAQLARHCALPVVFWSLLIGVSAFLSLRQLDQQALDIAAVQGRDVVRLVQAMRSWNAEHGGIFVTQSAQDPPNPHLDHPESSTRTIAGRTLTLLNPAYMTRQVAGVIRDNTGISIHLTSLKPLNPDNQPSDWEKAALQAFEQGQRQEIIELGSASDPQLARYMAPLYIEKSCLACHGKQGYQAGELRGGISVQWSVAPLLDSVGATRNHVLAIHAAVWLLVVGFLVFGIRRLLRHYGEIKRVRDDLAASNAQLEKQIEKHVEAEAREQCRNRVLELITENEALPVVLEAIARSVEQLNPGMLCSILLLDSEGRRLVLGAAPSLPDFYNRAIDGIAVGENIGSCGAAAFTGQPVIVEDIATHPDWAPYRALAAQAGLRACWSHPIRSSSGTTLGAFAIYHRTVHRPSFADALMISEASRLCSIAIDHSLAEEKLLLAASVFTHAREGILITSADGAIIDVNRTFSQITGYDRAEVLGKNPRLLKSGNQEPTFYADMWHELGSKGEWSGEIWNRRKNGEIYPEMLTISAVLDPQGRTQHYVALFSDITQAKTHERQLVQMAHYDALTKLPNRVLLADRLTQALLQAHRHEQSLAVAYLDLDGFKAVNDQFGHEAGDQLLIALSQRMKQALRESDTLARLGGDEFVAVLHNQADIQACAPMLARLLSVASQPVEIEGRIFQVSASLGITFYPQSDNVDADQLLRQSDQAMYQAKLSGKNRYHVFDAERDRHLRGHHESLEHIRLALAADEFVLHYQPKVNMRTGCVIGVEALIRWRHPQRGLLSPNVFLPVIETHPLATAIGEWVIASALSQMQRWQDSGLRIPVSINVGAYQLQHGDFVARLRTLLTAQATVAPADLTIEILETSALEDLVHISAVIEECRTMGIGFSLDDFGTGYSSLTYLKRLAVNQLKIDRSFVHDMLDDPDDLSILGGVLSLASAFNRQVLAEGVETQEHGSMLLQLGCELAQGYGIARPMPAADIPGWAATWQPYDAWRTLPAVNRDDLPILFAIVEHWAWIAVVDEYLHGKRTTLPLAHHQCRFSQWTESEGQALHGEQATFQECERIHRQTHRLADELCQLRVHGRHREALAGLAELHRLSEAMHEKLSALTR